MWNRLDWNKLNSYKNIVDKFHRNLLLIQVGMYNRGLHLHDHQHRLNNFLLSQYRWYIYDDTKHSYQIHYQTYHLDMHSLELLYILQHILYKWMNQLHNLYRLCHK